MTKHGCIKRHKCSFTIIPPPRYNHESCCYPLLGGRFWIREPRKWTGLKLSLILWGWTMVTTAQHCRVPLGGKFTFGDPVDKENPPPSRSSMLNELGQAVGSCSF